MNSKRWVIACFFLTVFLLVLGALPTVIIDPYFHFHAPLASMSYAMDNPRYQNDGILKHFSYDAIITGTSMTERFKASEFDQIFNVESIKVPFPGGSYKEISDRLNAAFQANPEIQYVVRGIDCNRIIEHKDALNYDADMYPWYLYDRKLYNDVSYVLNKHILLNDTKRVLGHTNAGIKGTTFDEYSNDYEGTIHSKAEVLGKYNRPEKKNTKWETTEDQMEMLRASILQNFVAVAKDNPDTEFYYFFTPYSIVWWDSIHQTGETERYIDLMKEASRLMVEYDNIHLFSFFDAEEVICNLDLYRDILHYSDDVNTQMLYWMKSDEYRLTNENYVQHWEEMRTFFNTYNYESLFP